MVEIAIMNIQEIKTFHFIMVTSVPLPAYPHFH